MIVIPAAIGNLYSNNPKIIIIIIVLVKNFKPLNMNPSKAWLHSVFSVYNLFESEVLLISLYGA